MHIIEGSHVDLITPYPMAELHRIYGWLHCYKTIADTDDFPATSDEFVKRFSALLPHLWSFAVIDRNNELNTKHEAPLVGVIFFEQLGKTNGQFHIASTRRAWGSGFMQEAGHLALKEIFKGLPHLTRVTAQIMATNAPAKSFTTRMGFEYEGVLRDAVIHKKELKNLICYGLTRRKWVENLEKEATLDGPVIQQQQQHNLQPVSAE